MIIVLLMLTSALAGCAGDDTSDLEQQIADLQQSNDEMNETINQQNQDIEELQSQLEEINTEISMLLQSTIADAESHRDSLLILLEDSGTYNDELESMIEAANNSILTLQSELVVQQNLVNNWIESSLRNDFTGVDISFWWNQSTAGHIVDLRSSLYNSNMVYVRILNTEILDMPEWRMCLFHIQI